MLFIVKVLSVVYDNSWILVVGYVVLIVLVLVFVVKIVLEIVLLYLL